MRNDDRQRRGGYTPNPKRHSIKNQPARPTTSAPAGPASNFVGHEPCPKCPSSDAFARYDDGHGYCFVCKHYEPGDGPVVVEAGRVSRAPTKLLPGQPKALPARLISFETCKKFSYWISDLGDEEVQIANYYDADNRRVAQKIRTADKQFRWRGDSSQAVFFGQQLWRSTPVYSDGDAELDGYGGHAAYLKTRTLPPGNRLILTEGEIDALSVAEVLGLKCPVVSVPNGAAAALGSVQKNFDWVSQFSEIVFLFDQDDAGEKAARECAALFPDRARIARLPLKDANEMLVAERGEELVRAIFDAQPHEGARP